MTRITDSNRAESLTEKREGNTMIISRPDSDVTIRMLLWDKEDLERLRKIGEEIHRSPVYNI